MAQPSEHESAYVPSVQFREGIEAKVIDPYIEKKLQRFFHARESVNDLDEVHQILSENAITDLEWTGEAKQRVSFKYLYRVVMEGARKVDGEINHTAYTLTFDHELTPDQCEETGTYYGCMTLAGEPILYWIRLSLPELIAQIRKKAFQSTSL
jgi:hypothetical protein